MRTYLNLGSWAVCACFLASAIACGGDDKSSGSSSTGSSSTGGSGGSGGESTSSGNNNNNNNAATNTGGSGGSGGSGGAATGGSGGSGGSGTGGSAGAPADTPPYTNANCTNRNGPGNAVKNSGTGAFRVENDWLDGWTNWSVTETPDVDDSEIDDAESFPTTGDRTLSEGMTYTLDERVYVADGETLTIEPGVHVLGGTDGVLVVQRGGMIDAVGTAEDPIIFTSSAVNGEKAPGQWGGIILLGKGKNFAGTDVLIEGLDDQPENYYGGNDDEDNSGTMQYVRIEFGGTEIGEGNEINGLTFGSVGSGTTIDHIEVNTNLDDCYEWFGGAVEVDHLVCNNGGDDNFDADQGFRGSWNTMFGVQRNPLSSDPNGFEMDSDKGGKTPVSFVTASDVTLCGTGEDLGAIAYGMVLREGLTGDFTNIVVSGFDAGVDTRDDFGTNNNPNVDIKDSMFFEGRVHDIAYVEDHACEEDSEGNLDYSDPECDDDMGFDEIQWFDDGDGDTNPQ